MKWLYSCIIIIFLFQTGNAQHDFKAFSPLPSASNNFRSVPKFNPYRMFLEMAHDKEVTYQIVNKYGVVLAKGKFRNMVFINTWGFEQDICFIRVLELNWELKVDWGKIAYSYSMLITNPYSKIMYRR